MGKGIPRIYLVLIYASLWFLQSCTAYKNKGYDDYDNQAPTLIKTGAASIDVMSPLADCAPYLNGLEAAAVMEIPVQLEMQAQKSSNSLVCNISAVDGTSLATCTIGNDIRLALENKPHQQIGDWLQSSSFAPDNLSYDSYGSWLDQSEAVLCHFQFFSAQDFQLNRIKVEKQAAALTKLLSREL